MQNSAQHMNFKWCNWIVGTILVISATHNCAASMLLIIITWIGVYIKYARRT